MAYTKGNPSSDPFTIMEPQSAANENERSIYPYNHAWYTESGHTLEMDDTPDRERIRLQHRSKTFVEMHPNGDEVHKIYGDGYELVIKNKKVKVYGTCTVVVMGDAAMEVKGSAVTKVEGDSVNYTKGKTRITCEDDINITSDKKITISSSSDLSLKASTLRIEGDVHVKGELRATRTIYSDGNITAGHDVVSLFQTTPSLSEFGIIGVPTYPVGLTKHIHYDPLTVVTGPPVPWISVVI